MILLTLHAACGNQILSKGAEKAPAVVQAVAPGLHNVLADPFAKPLNGVLQTGFVFLNRRNRNHCSAA